MYPCGTAPGILTGVPGICCWGGGPDTTTPETIADVGGDTPLLFCKLVGGTLTVYEEFLLICTLGKAGLVEATGGGVDLKIIIYKTN